MQLDPVDHGPAVAMDGADPNSGVYALFYSRAVQNNAMTREQGRPVFVDVDYVEIIIPADKHAKVDRPARDEDKQRWPREWAKYEAGQQAAVTGTPLTALSWLMPSQVKSLEAVGILTVEHLAGVSDGNLKNLGMGGRDMRERARNFLKVAEDQSHVTRLSDENQALKDQVELLKEDLAHLQKQFADMQAEQSAEKPAPRKRKRVHGDAA